MDQAQLLIRKTVRAFYDEPEYTIIIEALILHGSLSAYELAKVIDPKSPSPQTKTVQKWCARLKADALISATTQSEYRAGVDPTAAKVRPTPRDYYYIDYRRAVDSVKFRIHVVQELAKKNRRHAPNRKEFFCQQCRGQYAAEDLDFSVMGSVETCPRCGFKLTYRDISQQGPDADDEVGQLNKQMRPFEKLLQAIDNVPLEETNGQLVFTTRIELPRDEVVDGRKDVAMPQPIIKPQAVHGRTGVAEKIDVSISTSVEATAAEQAAENDRKAKFAAQNQLPVWHTQSTVTGASTGKENGVESTTSTTVLTDGTATEEEDKQKVNKGMEDYFAALAAEQREQAAREASTSDDDEEEDEEFEDVPVDAALGATPETKRVKLDESALKVEEKLKAEETPDSSAPASVAPSVAAGGDEDSEDDDGDFEDVN